MPENVIHVHDKNVYAKVCRIEDGNDTKMDWVNIFNGTLKAAAWFRR